MVLTVSMMAFQVIGVGASPARCTKMPLFDGTGPDGQGAKTGRQMGNCDGAKPIGGRGRGRGFGRRRGRGLNITVNIYNKKEGE